MSDKSGGVWVALAVLVGGAVLLSDPHCKHGCRTLAQHLIVAGGESLFGGLS